MKKMNSLFLIFLILLGCSGKKADKLPIVYSDHYSISFFGLENLHSFDTGKHKRIFSYLKKRFNIRKEHFYKSPGVTREQLLTVHSPQYLKSLNDPAVVAGIAEIGVLKMLPSWLLRRSLLRPLQYGTGGTILGTKLARTHGWAINLSGGFHHAKAESGGGFCFYADVPIAVYEYLDSFPDSRVLIIDLDAHQGNGHESIFGPDSQIIIMDVYNKMIYPGDEQVKNAIDYDFPLSPGAGDSEFLSILENNLPGIIEKEKPGLIIYLAGTDVYKNDPLGGLSLTQEGIIRRDGFVFETARLKKVPVLMVLSGGYSKESWKIIGRSVENIIKGAGS